MRGGIALATCFIGFGLMLGAMVGGSPLGLVAAAICYGSATIAEAIRERR
jgi:hypothetical protein